MGVATASAPTRCWVARPDSTSTELTGARRATSANVKSDAALKLARTITLQRGHISDADLQAARSASLSDAEVVEIVEHVALNIFTNYVNNVARTVIDFPEVKPGEPEPVATGL